MIIDGRKIAQGVLAKLKADVSSLPFVPVFCDVLVGDDPASRQYVRMKATAAEKIGMKFRAANFPADVGESALISDIKTIGQEPNMCGLIVQLPLPAGFPRKKILDAIDPAIDVDSMGSKNLKSFYYGDIRFVPPTAAAIIAILETLDVNLQAKQFLVLGQGELVGRPVTFLLKRKGYNVSIADINTKNTEELLRSSDVIISATGKAGLITGEKIKKGSIVIDAGTSESNLPAGQAGGGIVGDADFESVSKVSSYISPVPGGVGPVTVAMLLGNVVVAAKHKVG